MRALCSRHWQVAGLPWLSPSGSRRIVRSMLGSCLPPQCRWWPPQRCVWLKSNRLGALAAQHQPYTPARCTHSAAASAPLPSIPQQQLEPPQTPDRVLLLGFPREDLDAISHNITTIFPDFAPHLVASVPPSHTQLPLSELLTQEARGLHQLVQSSDADADEGAAQHPSTQSVASLARAGRLVYLVGPSAAQMGHVINDGLVQAGVAPAVVGTLQPSHLSQPLASTLDRLRASHAAHWGLVRPVALAGPLDQLLADFRPDAPGDHALAPLASSSVTLTARLDAGRVPSPAGGWRQDEAELVVLDGLISDAERQEILDWLTGAGHDHQGPPPTDKWAQTCVDREGDAATWGLQAHLLQALQDDPPPAVVALQTRLAALYAGEYTLAHAPADTLCESEEVEDSPALSSFVANAVMHGDPCGWHDDADPAILPPSSPWVHNYGYYYNREPGRPRFVSVLLYLNDAWSEELHAETMFVDPAAEIGLFVRPSPGRVVIMDQDVSHRIVAPSLQAGGAPRYSLVWKMVWFAESDPTVPPAAATPRAVGEGRGGLCKPDTWGAPLCVGSAGNQLGTPVWPRL